MIMMEEEKFYVYLPSNANVENNTPSNFTVRLPTPLELEGSWSLALTSIIYPVSYQSESEESLWLGIDKETGLKRYTFPAASFTSVAQMEKMINETIFGGSVIRSKREIEHQHQQTLESDVEGEEEEANLVKRETTAAVEVAETKRVLSEEEKKQMRAAYNEVVVRTSKKSDDLQRECDEEITNTEYLAAKIQFRVNELNAMLTAAATTTTELERKDFNKRLRGFMEASTHYLINAQTHRSHLVELASEYLQIKATFTHHYENNELSSARFAASRAKTLVKKLEDTLKFVKNEVHLLEAILNFQLPESKLFLSELLIPIDESTKANIERVIFKIRSLIPADRLRSIDIYFHFDDNTGRFFVYNNKPNEIRGLFMSKKLANMRGIAVNDSFELKNGSIHLRRGGGFAQLTPDLSSGNNYYFVYLPGTIENSPVGDTNAPLLRIVSVRGQEGEVVESLYIDQNYIKVTPKRLDAITVNIRNAFNESIKFKTHIVLTLVFRRNYL